ncbi:hypothetical protein FSP39_007375 [Pinctada imbricata]|uniref:G-protein coupled receptors family 1 profile domain-containing protein n=1 Tax=Pinctada imbricata TaxID=66713 RepID=A0AA88Y6R0_PINIB|nr:hypothetical protein FSP39_007375 [Pinctada imbricata]
MDNITIYSRTAYFEVTENSTFRSFSLINSTGINLTDETSMTDPIVEELEQVSKYLWVVISPILFLVGFVGNVLIVIVLWKLTFWRKTAYLCLALLAVSDLTVLCVGLSRYWIDEEFGVNVRTLSNSGCKINLFVIYWSMQFSSWLLVCVVVERFLKTNFPLRYQSIVSTKRCILCIVTTAVFLAGLDLHFFWTNGLIVENGEVDCSSLNDAYFQFEEKKFTYMDFAFLSAIPFFLMVIMNVFIYKVLRESRKWRETTVRNQHASSERLRRFDIRLTRTLFFSSIYFLLATTPISLYFIIDSYVKLDDVGEARKDVIWTVCYLLQFSNYAVNFFIYNLTNAKFKNTLKGMFGCPDKRIYRSKYSTRRSTVSSIITSTTSVDDSQRDDQDEQTSESRESEGYV